MMDWDKIDAYFHARSCPIQARLTHAGDVLQSIGQYGSQPTDPARWKKPGTQACFHRHALWPISCLEQGELLITNATKAIVA